MSTRRGLLAGLLTLALLGAGALGCDHSSGRQLGANSSTSPDLTIENRASNTINVYVDGGEIGAVQPFANGDFQILSGTRTVEVRETGHSSYTSFGDVHFGFSKVTLTYRP